MDRVTNDKVFASSIIHGGLILNSIKIIIFVVVVYVLSSLLANSISGLFAFLLPAIVLIANVISIVVHIKNN